VDGYWTHTFRFELPLSAWNEAGDEYGTQMGGTPYLDLLSKIPLNVSRLNVTHLRNMVTERLGEMPANQVDSNPLNDVRQATRELSLATLRSVQHLIDRIKSLLPDLALRDRRRQYRGLANFIGDVSSYLFGTATESDIDGLRQEIRKIKDWAGTAKTDNERTREGLATFTRLSNTRFDAMRDILDRDQKEPSSCCTGRRNTPHHNYIY